MASRHRLQPIALGIDFGRVIMCPPDHVEGADTRFLALPEPEAVLIPPPDQAFEVIAVLMRLFESRVWIVSKAGPRVRRLTLLWLEEHRFFERTGMNRSAVRFCRERREKREHAEKLKLTHFIDD